jgi:hypothetical protein
MDPVCNPEGIGPPLAVEEPQGELAEAMSVEEEVERDDQAQNDLKPDLDGVLGRLDGARWRVDQAEECLPDLGRQVRDRVAVPGDDDRVAEKLAERRTDDVVPARR